MYRQLMLDLDQDEMMMYFSVKFYAPDPAKLEDELTRYLFCLQIKRDLFEGSLQCSELTSALLSSYFIQSEFGDFPVDGPDDDSYKCHIRLYLCLPHRNQQEFEFRLMENHKRLEGMSANESDLHLLQTVRKCDFYGVKLSPITGPDGGSYEIAVNHLGILVFQKDEENIFKWNKIKKLSFKRKKFIIKLHEEVILSDLLVGIIFLLQKISPSLFHPLQSFP